MNNQTFEQPADNTMHSNLEALGFDDFFDLKWKSLELNHLLAARLVYMRTISVFTFF